jgi:hypothetical protein
VPATDGFFYVKSSYNVLLQSYNSIVLDPNVMVAIQKLWKNDVPSKVIVFALGDYFYRDYLREML